MNTWKLRIAFLFVSLIGLATPLGVQGQEPSFGNTADYSSGRFKWTIYVNAPENELSRISSVQYTLHESFPQPVQKVSQRGAGKCAFPLSSNSWGEFEVKVRIYYRDGSSKDSKYWLNLLNNKSTAATCSATKSKTVPKPRRRTTR